MLTGVVRSSTALLVTEIKVNIRDKLVFGSLDLYCFVLYTWYLLHRVTSFLILTQNKLLINRKMLDKTLFSLHLTVTCSPRRSGLEILRETRWGTTFGVRYSWITWWSTMCCKKKKWVSFQVCHSNRSSRYQQTIQC